MKIFQYLRNILFLTVFLSILLNLYNKNIFKYSNNILIVVLTTCSSFNLNLNIIFINRNILFTNNSLAFS